MIERQELWCHNCERYVQFDLDLALNGNHVLNCPNCGHEHCRVVRDGKITGDRWDQRNYTIYVSTIHVTSTTVSTASSTTSGSYYLADSWLCTMSTA